MMMLKMQKDQRRFQMINYDDIITLDDLDPKKKGN